MRKTLTVVAILAAALAIFPGRGEARPWLEPAVKGGLNFASASVRDRDDIEYRNTFGLGVGFRFNVSELVSIQPEVLYMRKGFQYRDSIMTFTPYSNWYPAEYVQLYRLDYLEIPVLVRFQLPEVGRFSPGLYIGPAVAINLNESLKTTAIARLDGDTYERPYEEKMQTASIDIGLVLGAGFEYPMGPGKLLLEGRYTNGFKYLDDWMSSPYDLRFSAKKVLSRVISIMLGYSFAIGGN